MKKISLIIISMIIAMTNAMAHERTVESSRYTDLRQFHFGVLVGGHVQDLELLNVGQQTITKEDGTQSSVLISADQDRYDAGFHVGVLGEIRLTEHLQLRVAPAMYFGFHCPKIITASARKPKPATPFSNFHSETPAVM